MNYCTFVTEREKCVCSRCKKPYHRQICPEKAVRACGIQPVTVPKIQQPINFVKALITYYKSGYKKVTKAQYEERLKICDPCRHREDNDCTICGCKLASKVIIGKASLPSETCPINKWPILT